MAPGPPRGLPRLREGQPQGTHRRGMLDRMGGVSGPSGNGKIPAPPKPKAPNAARTPEDRRNPPSYGPKDPEPPPGTGRLPLPPPRPGGPRRPPIPGGGQGGSAPGGYGGPRRLPPLRPGARISALMRV